MGNQQLRNNTVWEYETLSSNQLAHLGSISHLFKLTVLPFAKLCHTNLGQKSGPQLIAEINRATSMTFAQRKLNQKLNLNALQQNSFRFIDPYLLLMVMMYVQVKQLRNVTLFWHKNDFYADF